MPTDDLDLSRYDPLVVEHALYGYARQQAFLEAHGEAPKWNCDLSRGVLEIDGRTYDVDLLGTRSGDTFLWSWANPGVGQWAPRVTEFAASLRHRGETEAGLAVFRERKVSTEWVESTELGLVCSELAEGRPLFEGDAGATRVSMLVHTKTDVRPHLASLPRLLIGFQPLIICEDPRGCVHRFLERIGYRLTRTSKSATEADAPEGSIAIHWDDDGNITEAQLR